MRWHSTKQCLGCGTDFPRVHFGRIPHKPGVRRTEYYPRCPDCREKSKWRDVAAEYVSATVVRVALTQGHFTLIDAADAEAVLAHRWLAVRSRDGFIYAARNIRDGRQRRFEYLHKVIAGAKPDERADHRDGDTLNNRRSNLRRCTTLQNAKNAHLRRTSKSGFKGVCFKTREGRWCADIAHDKQRYALGLFDTAEEAARAYDDAARQLHGEFACLNFPRVGERGARTGAIREAA